MAHNINENRVMTVGASWHRLGNVAETEQTAKETVRLARLDYNVTKVPSGYLYNNQWHTAKEDFTIIRTDNGEKLGDCKGTYQVIQNVDAFGFFDTLVGEGQAIYHSAGALGKGERIWILAKLPNNIVINQDDIVEKYLCLTTSHDGKSSLKMYFTPVRVVCQNTLNLSMSNSKNGISIRHSANYKTRIDEARKVLGISINYYDQFEKIVKQLENIDMDTVKMNEYFDKVLSINDENDVSTRKENQKNELITLFSTGKGQKLGNKHSAWKAYNAVTEYVDHFSTVRNLQEDKSNKLKSIWFGNGAKLKEKAYNEAVALI